MTAAQTRLIEDLPILQAVQNECRAIQRPTTTKTPKITIASDENVRRSLSPFEGFLQSAMCPSFVRDVASSAHTGHVLNTNVDGIHVSALFVDINHTENSRPTYTYHDMEKLWRVLYIIVPALRKSLDSSIARIELVLMLTQMPKHFPSSLSSMWLPEHVNTGVSLVSHTTGTGSNIMVYRREEFIKVTIHELLHCFGADAHMPTYMRRAPHVSRHIKSQAHVDSNNLCLGEAYVEAYAVLCYAVCAAHITHKPVARLISQQVARAIKVMRDVWREWQGANRTLREGTPVFAYYFAKAGLLVSNGDALRQCPRHGIRNDDDATQFVHALLTALGSSAYARCFTVDSQRRQYTLENNKELLSARMSVMQLGELVA